MIKILLTGGHRYTHADLEREAGAPRLRALTYDELFRSRRLPRATYIFTDLDRLAYADLELAGRLAVQMREAGLRVLNDPARVKTRYALLRALARAGLNDFQVHRAGELDDAVRYPVFVRKAQGHGQPCSDLLQTRAEVEECLSGQLASGVPLEHLVVIEYAGEPVRPGVYRKLSGFRIGTRMVPGICFHYGHWLVKQGSADVAGEDLYEEELRGVRDNLYAPELQKAFDLAGIDYGRADFGFYRGRLQVFEINTNPHMPPPPPHHPSPARIKSMAHVWDQILEAFQAIDTEPGSGVLLPKDRLFRPYRRLSGRLYRTRPVS